MDDMPYTVPRVLDAILTDADRLGFAMSCEARTGSLLATLAATKPEGRLLELGTGVGAGAAWLLHGMAASATLLSVEADPTVQDVAARHLGHDPRVEFVTGDADAWLDSYAGPRFDLAYVDCRPGKFHRLPDLLDLLAPGGIYVVDDLLPQATWPHDHQGRVDGFLQRIPAEERLHVTAMAWGAGVLVGARR